MLTHPRTCTTPVASDPGRNQKKLRAAPLSFGCGDLKGLLLSAPDIPLGTPTHSWAATLAARKAEQWCGACAIIRASEGFTLGHTTERACTMCGKHWAIPPLLLTDVVSHQRGRDALSPGERTAGGAG